MNLSLLASLLLVLASAGGSVEKNPVFKELLEQGVKMSDGTAVKLPPPILADGLDAAGQKAALSKVADARSPVAELVKKSFYAPDRRQGPHAEVVRRRGPGRPQASTCGSSPTATGTF